MMKFMRKSKGFISIFLCLVLLPMVTYSTMVIDVSRIQNARALVTSAGDLAMNAGMSEYHKTLQEMYGIFATNTSDEDLEKALANYFAKTIEGSIGTSDLKEQEYIQAFSQKFMQEIFQANGDGTFNGVEFTNFMQMVLDAQEEASKGFEYGCVDNSSPANPAVMKQQIVDYMKYKGPVSLSMNLLDKVYSMRGAKKQSEVVEKKLDYTKTLDDITDPCEKAFKAVYGEDTDYSTEDSKKGYNDYVDDYNKKFLSTGKDFENGLASDSKAYQYIKDNMEKMTEFAVYYTVAMIASGQIDMPNGAAGYNMSTAGLKGLNYRAFEDLMTKNHNDLTAEYHTVDACCEVLDKLMTGKTNPAYSYSNGYAKNSTTSSETNSHDFIDSELANLLGGMQIKVKLTTDTKYKLTWSTSTNDTNTRYIKEAKVESATLESSNNNPDMSKDLITQWKELIKSPVGQDYAAVSEADGKAFDLILQTLDKDEKYKSIKKKNKKKKKINDLKGWFNSSWDDYDQHIATSIEAKKNDLKNELDPNSPIKERYDYVNSETGREQLAAIQLLEEEVNQYDNVTIPQLQADLDAKNNEYAKCQNIYENYVALLDFDDKTLVKDIKSIIDNETFFSELRDELADILNENGTDAEKIKDAFESKKTLWETRKSEAEAEKNTANQNLNNAKTTRNNTDSARSAKQDSYNVRIQESENALAQDAEYIVKNEEKYYDKQVKKEVVAKLAEELNGIDGELRSFLDNNLSSRVGEFKEHGKPYLKNAMTQLQGIYVCVCNAYNFADKADAALGEVLNHYDAIETALQNWKKSASEVEDNTTKVTMVNDANNTSSGLKKEDIQNARKAAKNRANYFKNLKDMLECIKFFGDGQLIDKSKTINFQVTDAHVNNVYTKILAHNAQNGLGFVRNEETDRRKHDAIKASAEDSKSKDLVRVHLSDSRNNSKTPEAFEWKPSTTSLAKENDYEIKFGDMMEGFKTVSIGSDESYDYEVFFKVLINIVKPKENNDPEAKAKADNIKQLKNDAINDKGEMPSTSSSGSGSGKVEKQTSTAETVQYKDDILASAQKSINEYGENGGRCEDNTNDAGDERKDVDLSGNKKQLNKNSDKAKESMNQAGNLLDSLSRLGRNALQDAYLEEYFTEMFTCQTDILYKNVETNNAKMLNGVAIKEMYLRNTAWYGGEIEYIIWGGSGAGSAKIKNEVAIYALRLVFNLIYAFTAADIQEFTLSAATAIAGWTVVGVPLVQVLLTVGLAAAESALDLVKLKNGEDVAIYKNASTFVCSPSGALQQALKTVADCAIEAGTEYAQKKIDETVEKIADSSAKKIEDITDDLKDELKTNFVDAQAENLASTVKNMIATPIIDQLRPVFILKDTAQDKFEAEVKSKVDSAFNSIRSSIDTLDNDIVKAVANKVLDVLEVQVRGELSQAECSIFAMDINKFADHINKQIDKVIEDNATFIDSKLDVVKSNFDTELEKYKDQSVNKIKEITAKSTKSAAETLSSKSTKLIDDTLDQHLKEINVNKVDSSSSGAITLNYKEYCKIFVLIGLISEQNQAAMLQRCAALCQVNVQHPGEGKFDADESFEMVKVNTVVTVHAKVKLGTLFPWGVTLSENGTGDSSVNLTKLGGHEVIIDYQGVNAY